MDYKYTEFIDKNIYLQIKNFEALTLKLKNKITDQIFQFFLSYSILNNSNHYLLHNIRNQFLYKHWYINYT